MNNKKVIFSGIKPSGDLHLGNYLGAISQWVELQDKYECLFCVVNYHAITVRQDPETLKQRTKDIVRVYLASGINPKKSTIFLQSDVYEHTELAWILNCTSTRMSDLNKMTQFKDKARNNGTSVSVGLFDYPVLMAADILLYNTDIVPVGDDQVQHVELCRDLAKRFNHDYAPTFKLPEVMIRKQGARIMSLSNPENKMSKSAEGDSGCIFLNDALEAARKKIMKAVTDSGSEVKYDLNEKPALSNLMTIYHLLTGESYKDIKKDYEGQGYGDFKKGLADVVVKFLTEFQKKYNAISDKEVAKVLERGATCAKVLAQETIKKVKERVGII
ncbi:tryptophan--tRNA ligase [Candidatus Falkowbacteria bacterium CG_4_10_14_0_2_um_filter_41_15]|uniref:Tryptophan--tRNA ligase n=4 Tax=Candidatus Falkowiibacteriota TaxID=1752728 RepID=A0A2G9ZNN0_9BACT|nr:MAG: tryptophan--tRNA ligase [Candidatus Falkowbacteria bacterium CG1_02_41_21]PIP34744.1 MAG: tryptophan--tRNA ligase [Candidatus Falkowbacteria bacterium CG23_combo_of_CG06-09_8_20_14_all_41_10]PIZ10371.1 MAG: tryptophan--tRNA ligase [Candidatus Falkowbacteria bacterium CG_4_10_14_0_8_um_filter_41_36]PJA09174.1 MAG: tryptophan--tRNA ligase [Candidatus Falkowbacteria bacterium CG_4_10_14_0_2_um_filter_41_15]